MDAVLALLGIIVICITCSSCIIYALYLHHRREVVRLRIREFEGQQMAMISDKMLDKNMLPPMARTIASHSTCDICPKYD